MLSTLILFASLAVPQDYAHEARLGSDHFLQSASVDVIQSDARGQRIASCASGGEVAVWDANTGEAIARSELGLERALTIAFWGQDRLLIGDTDDHLRILELKEGALTKLDPFELGLGDLVDLGGSFALSPDEQQLVIWKSTGYTGDLMLADLTKAAGAPGARRAISVSEYRIDEVEWRADSSEFVVMSTNGMKALGRADTQTQASSRVIVLDRAGETLTQFDSQERFLSSIAYGPHDGQDGLFAGSTREGTYLWDRADGRQIMRIGDLETILTLDTSADGGQLLFSDSLGNVESWQLSLDAEPIAGLHRHVSRPLAVLVLDESQHMVGAQGRRVKRWALDGMEPDPNVVGHTGQLVTLDLQGDRLLSLAMDGSLTLWNLSTKQGRGLDTSHEGLVFDASLSPDGATAATCGQDASVRLWNVADGEEFGKPLRLWGGRSNAAFTDVAFSPKGDSIAAVSADGILWIWSLETGDLLRTFEGLSGLQFKLVYSADGERLALGSSSIRIWQTSDWSALSQVNSLGAPIMALSFSPDSNVLAVGLASKVLVTLDVVSGTEIKRSEPLTGRVSALCFTQVGLAATAPLLGGVRIFDMDLNGIGMIEIPRQSAVAALAAAGGRLITGDDSGRLDVWK